MQVLLQKVDSLAASQREILLLLRRNQGRQREDDILDLKTAQCKEELEDLENHLKEPEFRKKVVGANLIKRTKYRSIQHHYTFSLQILYQYQFHFLGLGKLV